MILSNELRVGNYVFFDTKDIKITAADIHYASENLEAFEPIRITPQILKQCGFEKDLDVEYKSKLFGRYYHLQLKCNIKEDKIFWWITSTKHSPTPVIELLFLTYEIIYLHQLQNLYFFLTGEEIL